MKAFQLKTMSLIISVIASLSLCANLNAAPRGGSKGGDGGNGTGSAVSGAQHAAGNVSDGAHAGNRDGNRDGDGAKAHVDVDGKNANINIDGNHNLANDRRDSRENRADLNLRANNRIGDRDFDRHGIGALDDRNFKNRSDNRWRYQHFDNQWWYWVPAGYWMYYRGDRWNRYDSENYITYYDYQNNNNVVSIASYSGPYYEDQNGFYYLSHGRKVYDNQIRRVAQ